MSMKIVEAQVYPKNNETLEELTERVVNNLKTFAKRHNDYTCVIDQYVDEGYIIIKSLLLKEHAN